MEQFIFYLWVAETAVKVSAISGRIILLISAVGFVAVISEQFSAYWKAVKAYLVIACSIFSISMLVPSEKIIYLYAGIKVGAAATELPEFDKARKLLNETLDGYLEEGKK